MLDWFKLFNALGKQGFFVCGLRDLHSCCLIDASKQDGDSSNEKEGKAIVWRFVLIIASSREQEGRLFHVNCSCFSIKSRLSMPSHCPWLLIYIGWFHYLCALSIEPCLVQSLKTWQQIEGNYSHLIEYYINCKWINLQCVQATFSTWSISCFESNQMQLVTQSKLNCVGGDHDDNRGRAK